MQKGGKITDNSKILTDRRWLYSVLGLIFVSVLIRAIFGLTFYQYFIDDTYIFLRYAGNLASGQGLVYNIGDRVMGFSSPLYTLLLGMLVFALSFIGHYSLVLGTNLILWAVLLVLILYNDWTEHIYRFVFGIVFSLYFPFIDATLTGMETVLFMLLLFLSLMLASNRRYGYALIALALLCLTRPEGFVVSLVVFAFILYKNKGLPPIKYFVAPVLIIAAWFIFAQIYYGSIIPQSMQAKAAGFTDSNWYRIDTNLFQKHILFSLSMSDRIFLAFSPLIRSFLGIVSFLSTIFFGWGFYVAVKRRKDFYLISALVYLALFTFYLAGNPISIFSWYTVPTSMLFLFTSIFGITEIVKDAKSFRSLYIGTIILGSVFSIYFALPIRADRIRERAIFSQRIVDRIEEKYPETQSIMVGDIGYIGYASSKRIYDLGFLVTDVSQSQLDQLSLYGYIETVKPDVFIPGRSLSEETEKYRSAFGDLFKDESEKRGFNKIYKKDDVDFAEVYIRSDS